jgi:predicted 2-oxoglutarate/Fe(II)-dependent dioxygenase YbiX/peroxiredoxin
MLTIGDPIPALYVRTLTKPRFSLGSIAGRYLIISFVGSLRAPGAANFVSNLTGLGELLDDEFASAFIVTNDRQDENTPVQEQRGIRILLDAEQHMLTLFGCSRQTSYGRNAVAQVTWILDAAQRVCRIVPVGDIASHHKGIRAELAVLRGRPAPQFAAPVLEVPNIFEPEFCRQLQAFADSRGMEESGFMNTDQSTGQTILAKDFRHKRRLDAHIDDEPLCAGIRARLQRRLVPQIERAFQFKATRIERYIVACYEASSSGHFRAHRDNTTFGTAHRRFAVSIGLNANYEGGELRFPEFGNRLYRPLLGGAVVFSCSLLHEVLPVTAGRRYAVLPFLYDEASAQVRLENARHLQDRELRESVIRSVQ